MKTIARYPVLTVVLVISTLLTGCGGEGSVSNPWQDPPALRFAFPFPGQTEVPVTTPLVLHFSEALDQATQDQIDAQLKLVIDGEDDAVAANYSLASDGRSILLRPQRALHPARTYRVTVGEDFSGTSGAVDASPFNDFTFTTAGMHVGARDELGTGDFALLEVSPLDTPPILGDIPLVDFSSFRLMFNYPLDSASPRYGDTVHLEERVAGSWALVHGVSLLHQGRYLALDPLEDLKPGAEYRLRLEGLKNIFGETLPPTERTGLAPRSTTPHETAWIKVGGFNEQGDGASRLTGELINSIPINSFVLGNEVATDLHGDLAATLGFVPNFPDAVPLRIPKGSVLTGSPVGVKVLGEVPAGLETGEITVTLLSDANGYMVPNPFSNANDAPRYAVLNMDVGMTAEGTEANAALSQGMVNLQIVGLAIVEGSSLVIDAVSVIEPEVLGLERASGLLSFRLETYPDHRTAPVPVPDDSPLLLQSWTPGEEFQSSARPGDPVILNFSKPVAADSVYRDGAITLLRDGVPLTSQASRMRVDGASVIIDGDLIEHGVDYDIVLSSLLEDTQGNPLNQDYTLALRLDDLHLPGGSAQNLRSPLVAMTYPGFPCALTGQVLSGPVQNWRNGRCVGGRSNDPLYPIPSINRDSPIRVIFSRSIDPTTVIDRQTFFVGRFEDGDWVAVPGRLAVTAQQIEFRPDEAWRVGSLYRYMLRSNGNHRSSNADCGVNAICSPDGAPLQTRQLSQSVGDAPTLRGGGPSMWNHFRVSDQELTLVALRALPTVDVNANLVHEPQLGEDRARMINGELVIPENSMQLQLSSTSGVITQANLGCNIGTNCPQNRFSYLSVGALPAELIGYDPDVQVNRRLTDGNPNTNDPITGAVRANVLPTTLSQTQVFMEAQILYTGLIRVGLDTGPLVLRIEYEPDGAGGFRPISGFITETPDGPWFSASLNLLVDAPELAPSLGPISLGHDIRSKRLTNVTLEGPLRFIDDGRLLLQASNPDPLVLDNNIDLLGIGLAGVTLRVPPGGARFTFTFLPVKKF